MLARSIFRQNPAQALNVSGGGGASAYDPNVIYPINSLVTFDGHTWQSNTTVSKLQEPAGVGDGSTADRDRLLARRHGYAATVTGGNAGSTVIVTSNAASGVGTLKAALEASGAAWIVFDPALGSTVTIDLGGGSISPKPNKTVDGRGRRVIIKNGNTFYKGNVEGNVANLIFAYLEYKEVGAVSTQFLNFGANGNGNSHGGADLVWIHHVSVQDNRDTMISGGFFGTNESRFTLDWVKYGPNPGATLYANKPTGGGSDWNTGKAINIGFNKTLASNGVDGDQLTPGYGKVTHSHNWFMNCVQRQPKGAGVLHHVYNNLWTRWGLPDGTISVGIEPDDYSEFLVEENVFRPYTVNERHWFSDFEGSTIPTTNPDLDAIKDVSATGFKLKTVDNSYLNSASAIADVNAGTIFTPPYSYTPLDKSVVEDIVSGGAGNFQPWTLVS